MWIVMGILGINALVIVAVALFLLQDWVRARREASEDNRRSTHSDTSE
jgi:uncharacterized membrane protein